jgi:hypothetical protein
VDQGTTHRVQVDLQPEAEDGGRFTVARRDGSRDTGRS